MSDVPGVQRFRSWVVVPDVQTRMHNQEKDFWNNIAAKVCTHCGEVIGTGVGVFIYHPEMNAAHVRCVDAEEVACRELRSNPFAREAAAKAGGYTIAQFDELPVWEKDRLLALTKKGNCS